MAIRDITAIVDLDEARPTAAVAGDLARRFDAHLTGLALVYDPVVPVYTVATPLPAEFIADAREQAVAEAKRAAESFAKVVSAAGVGPETRLIDSVGTSGFGDIVRQCALADLVVVGQQGAKDPEPMREALIEAVLFQAGVPTLIVPQKAPAGLGTGRAVIAWDGSATAARATREALPLLVETEAVTIVMVDDGKKPHGEPGAEAATYLARHGLNVTVRKIANAAKGGVAAALLAFAAEDKADFMVMGAYGHGRLREFILGGATRGVMDHLSLPVVMAH
jgi:nucleotide-binding universal stress UspA family protein